MDAGLRKALLELDCASLADADKSLRVVDSAIRPINPGRKLLGVARTVRCHEDFLTVIKALDESRPGEILVVDTQGGKRAVVGELFSLEAARRGLAGIIVDGAVRDMHTIRSLDMPVYARAFCPCSGTTRSLTETQCQIECGGVPVDPGDIVVGDEDGIVIATEEELHALVPTAMEIERTEAQVRDRMAAGTGLIDMLNYREHAAAVARGEDSKLQFKLNE